MHHHIKQTLFSIIILLVVGSFLYLGFSPNLKSMASYTEEKSPIYHLPNTEEQLIEENKINEKVDSRLDYGYLTKPQNLPSYFVSMVVDGSTIIVDDNKRVRLAGIKAPDKDEEMGIEATDFLKTMIEGKEIFLQIDTLNPKDDFGRLRGIIYFGEANINIEIIRAGLAHIYPLSPSIVSPEDWTSFEKEAREAKRGLWGGESYYNEFVKEVPTL